MKIIVNGLTKELKCASPLGWSYDAVCGLARINPETTPTVTYATASSQGSMVRGDLIDLSEGLIFNVCRTSSA